MDGFWPFCALGDALGDVTGDNITGGSTDSAGSGLGGDTAGDTGHSLVFPFFACEKIPKSFFGTAGLEGGGETFSLPFTLLSNSSDSLSEDIISGSSMLKSGSSKS